MSGFIVESVAPDVPLPAQAKLVDLAACAITRTCGSGSTRASWVRWPGSRQLHVVDTPRRLFFVEGQPDRLPEADEDARRWLEGRTGSFRGFQIEWSDSTRPDRICAFVDPLGTRPVCLLANRDRIVVADKLATLVANSDALECEWGPLLEGAALGSTYSFGTTTLRGACMLRPGEIIEIEGTAVRNRRARPYTLDSNAQPDARAAVRLEQALRTAIRETWSDADCRLLLSGGLDSRLLLGLADGPRKTMTANLYPRETEVARRVAEACDAEFEVVPFSLDHYCDVMANGFLVTAAMHQSRFVIHLGMASRWRDAGIPCITHGYFHNTVFRGWTAERWQRYPDRPELFDLMGPKAHYFERFGNIATAATTRGLYSLLSADGREELRAQLRALADSIEPVIIDGFDVTFERRLMQDIVRQVNFSVFLGWIEEIDVASPVFHPAIWRWYASSHPADRHRDHAVHAIYRTLDRGLADIPYVNTGQPVRAEPEPLRELVRNEIWFPAARAIVRGARSVMPKQSKVPRDLGLHWERIYRQAPIRGALEQGIAALAREPLFDMRALEAALDTYRNGDDRDVDALWAAATMGQWRDFVRTRGAGNRFVRHVGA